MVVMDVFGCLVISGILVPCLFGYNLDTRHIIMYEDPQLETNTRSSYFGFSVLLYSGSSSNEPWILIGAPRGNDTSLPCVKEPGLVFRCPIAKPCKILRWENYRNEGEKCAPNNVDTKKESWIGGAMDIRDNEEEIVICGYRRKSTIAGRNQVRSIPGACFVQNITQAGNNIEELAPLNRQEQFITSNVLDFAIGQAGMSVHFSHSEKLSELIIGAPGVLNWKGTTIIYQKSPWSRYYSYPYILQPSGKIPSFSYFGYQVSSGNFNRKGAYVASLPRGTSYKGSVFLYDLLSYRGFEIIKSVDGQKIGEYFGASLAVADVNGDGLDDIIVGAPQHTIAHDEGCIYVFIANPEATILETAIIIKGNQKGARFGSSVVAIGDVDRDGYQDIAVGAPYENNNTGAVYIYNGGVSGLKFGQKILAKDIHSRLQGFGFSISRSVDVDKNLYNDIAVGAFKSGHVILLRAHPVVSLSTYFKDVITQIKETDEKFDITVCYTYTGRDVPDRLRVLRTISVDENYQRWFIRNEASSNITVEKKGTCETLKVFSKTDDKNQNVFDPIKIKVSQELVKEEGKKTLLLIGKNTENKEQDGFKKDFPVVNMETSSLVNEIEIAFATDCENICDSELHMNSSFAGLIDGSYIIGSNSELALHIFVSNTGETAYNTEVNVTIPDPVQLSSGSKICQERRISRDLHLTCLVHSRLRTGTMEHLILPLDMNNIRAETQKITFSITVTTRSEDKNKLNNSQQIVLNFKTDANIVITGRSEKVVYSYFNASDVTFTQRYEVQKQGVSPIEVVEIDLNVPYIWKDSSDNNITILDIYDSKAEMSNRQSLTCLPEIKQVVEDVEKNAEYRMKRQVSSLQNEAIYQPPPNRTLYINCSTQNVVCFNIKCAAGPFRSNIATSASIQLKMSLNFTELIPIMGKMDIVHLATSGLVVIKKPDALQKSTRPQSIMVATSFTNTTNVISPAKSVSTWIVALAIIAGIFIFMLIVVGLMKAGFFERKKREELKNLKAVDAVNEFTIGNIQNSGTVNEALEQDHI